MGWISKRAHMTGSSIGGNPAKSALTARYPLRKIVRTLRHSESLFDYDTVEMECGHTGPAHGYYRARCRTCWEAENPVLGCEPPPKAPEPPRTRAVTREVVELLSGTWDDGDEVTDGKVRLSCGHEKWTGLYYRLGAKTVCRECPREEFEQKS